MKIAVFGCGYVGLTTAVGLAEMGNEVLGVDVDSARIEMLSKGKVPFFEPGMEEMMRRNLAEGRLTFTLDTPLAIRFGQLIFSAVGTPPKKNHEADLTAVLEVAKTFGQFASNGKIFVNKSTVPVGTSEKIRQTIDQNAKHNFDYSVISNPEFLREGTALHDFFNPDRIIIGIEHTDLDAKKNMDKLYRPMIDHGVPIQYTDIRSAEVIKYASNAFLATRISFVNELAEFCELSGADIKTVTKGMGLDKRIGNTFLDAGLGFGGSCLPKDLGALIEKGDSLGFDFKLLKEVQRINKRMPKRMLQKLMKHLPKLAGKNIAIWGLSFKPKTDDLREAPSLELISLLAEAQCKIRVFDPVSMENVKKLFKNNRKILDILTFSKHPYDALGGADALLIVTEWDEFRNPDYAKITSLMNAPIIIDGRNLLSPKEALEKGFLYDSFGRDVVRTYTPLRQNKTITLNGREHYHSVAKKNQAVRE
jgi:UDPglucose 6-dehydrogenase